MTRASPNTSGAFVDLRPYTLRSGDTFDSIAKKRDMTVEELMAINADLQTKDATPGKTILLPSSKLSKRDKEILGGIGIKYRVYPVRAGENLQDIMAKRRITDAEMKNLNPDLDLTKAVSANQLLKLPGDKFTVREREMLTSIVPKEFFAQATQNPFAIGGAVLLFVVGFVLAWQAFSPDKDFIAEE